MRGITAYANDFYFGGSTQTTESQEQSGNGAPAAPIAAGTAGGGGINMAQSLAGGGSAKSINPTDLIPGLKGVNPLWFIPIGLGLIVCFKLLREAGHKSGEFHPLKVDLYWFGMTVLAAVLGIPLVKAIANKYPIQPITDYINNA